MSFFREARGVSIGQGTFNVVTGNQTINTYKHYIVERQDKKRTIYDEFPDIQRGLVRRLKDVDRKDLLLRWNKRLKRIEVEFMVERTISTAKINGDTSSSFTVVSYKGQDAQKAWKKDFLRFFETICTTKMQLFGINRSSVPLLIFYGELVPLAHFWDRLGELGQSYAYTLAWDKWECSPSRVWIDTEQGILVHGLEGPDHNLFHFFITVEPLPSSVELLLEEDVCFRYFSRFPLVKKFDMRVIEVFHCASEIEEGGPWIVKRPCVVSSRTIFVIAVGREVWTVYGCLDNQVLMPDGRARFTLTSDEDSTSTFGFYSSKYRDETHWLSQAPSVFHRLGISLNKDLSSYKLILPDICLTGSIGNLQRCLGDLPIYFFLYPLKYGSAAIASHTWSYDENGKTSIPYHHCEYLGLPTKLSMKHVANKTIHWPSKTYKSIHKWQVARGFDPTTTEFARYLEYSLFEVQPLESVSSQIEELDMDPSEAPTSTNPENV